MTKRSNACIDKINKLPSGRTFEYKDIVEEDFPMYEHDEGGKIFKSEVENGVYSNVIVANDTAHTTVKYKKL